MQNLTHAAAMNLKANTVLPPSISSEFTSIMNTKRPCLVVGASGRIGLAIAVALAQSGRRLALTRSGISDVSASRSVVVRHAHWYQVDVRKPDAVQRTLREIDLDLHEVPDLVYAAGIVRDAPVALLSDDGWNEVISTNLTGAFYFIRGLAERLMAAEHGRIVLIGSIAASMASRGQSAYAASKGGLESLCRTVAAEIGRHGATCNVISPGGIEGALLEQTPAHVRAAMIRRTALRKLGQAQDVASLTRYLLSGDAGHITGQIIHLDGGASAL